MTDNNVQQNVPDPVADNVVEDVSDPVADNVVENVVEDVKEGSEGTAANKFAMPPKKKEEAAPVITNPDPVDASETSSKVNKKLSAMSKNTKEKQKNRKLSKPTVRHTPPLSLDINPMYLFGLLGVIIAAASLWYQRKSFLKDSEATDSGSDESAVQSTGGESTEKKSPPKKKKQHFDPWEWKREHQQTGIFPGNYDFD